MPSYNAHQVTREFEAELCRYTGAPYAVAVSSCTMALTLAVAWHVHALKMTEDSYRYPLVVGIPKRTYVSVPMSIIHAGGRPTFRDEEWIGGYQLKPLRVLDCARWFTGEMFNRRVDLDGAGLMLCVSFHTTKILGDTQGGAILHDNAEADGWLRRARFDGRTEGVAPKDDKFDMMGWHCYLSPDVSTRLLWQMASLPKNNDPLPNDDYPDLSKAPIFQ